MAYLTIIAGGIVGALIGLLLGASVFGLLGFVLIGLAAGFLALRMPAGVEWPYWLGVGLILLMIVMSYFGADISGFVFAAPIIFALCFFVSRTAKRFLPQN